VPAAAGQPRCNPPLGCLWLKEQVEAVVPGCCGGRREEVPQSSTAHPFCRPAVPLSPSPPRPGGTSHIIQRDAPSDPRGLGESPGHWAGSHWSSEDCVSVRSLLPPSAVSSAHRQISVSLPSHCGAGAAGNSRSSFPFCKHWSLLKPKAIALISLLRSRPCWMCLSLADKMVRGRSARRLERNRA